MSIFPKGQFNEPGIYSHRQGIQRDGAVQQRARTSLFLLWSLVAESVMQIANTHPPHATPFILSPT